MSSLPSSWETFVTTMCNASTTAVKYSEVTSAILTKAAQRNSFAKDSAEEAYVVQGLTDQLNNRVRRSSSRPPINQRSRSKSRDSRICNYCKKSEHIKADCRALKAKTDKAQKSGRHDEVNYVGSSAEILTTNPNILSIENPVESEVLLTIENSSTWLLDSGASSCDTSLISVSAIFGPTLLLSSSRKLASLCYNRNRHRRAQPSEWLYTRTTQCLTHS
mgnify:CR=1 FL=1